MNEVIVTTDLGHIKAYKISKAPYGRTKVEIIANNDNNEALEKFRNKVSDTAGNFISGGNGGSGFGEPHNIKIESRKRLIKHIATEIKKIINKDGCDNWYFAANKEINKQILENLDPALIKKMKKNVSSDLTKIDKSKMLDYFS